MTGTFQNLDRSRTVDSFNFYLRKTCNANEDR